MTTRARAEDVGPSAVEGGLAGLGLGWSTELLLGAGWPGDCAEAGAGRIPRPISAFASSCFTAPRHTFSSTRGRPSALLCTRHTCCAHLPAFIPPWLAVVSGRERSWPEEWLTLRPLPDPELCQTQRHQKTLSDEGSKARS